MKIRNWRPGIERDGWIRDMPEDVYHHGGPSDECSFHLAMKALDTSPAHARYAVEHPDTTDTDAKAFGRAMHAALLQGHRYDELVVVRPEEIKQRRGKAWDEFVKSHRDVDIITRAQQDEIDDIVEATFNTRPGEAPTLSAILLDPDQTQNELSGFFTDPLTGVRCRIRVDAWNHVHNVAVDLKRRHGTPTDTSIGRAAAEFHYPHQQAWYSDGIETLGETLEGFVFVFVGGDIPITVRPVTFGPEDIERARTINTRARELWAGCVEAGEWPGFGDTITPVEVPPWAWRTK